MAVADGVVPSPPPPPPPASRNIAASLARRRLGRAVTGAAVVVFFASMWLVSAGAALSVIGRRACGEGSPFYTATSKIIGVAGVTVALSCPISLVLVVTRMTCWRSVAVAVAEQGDQFQAPARKSIAKVAQELLRDTLTLGLITLMAFVLLILVGELLKGSKSIKGTRRERIGSMISDVGSFGVEAIYCLLILPVSMVRIWKSFRLP